VPHGSGAYGADNDELVQASQEFDPLNDHESVSTELSWITSVVNETIYRPCMPLLSVNNTDLLRRSRFAKKTVDKATWR